MWRVLSLSMSDKAYSEMSKRSDKHFMAIFENFLQKTVERIYSYFFFLFEMSDV